MGRCDALRIVKDGMEGIIHYLEGLEAGLKPVFDARGYKIFEVGVDVVETAVSGQIEYTVNVVNRDGNLLSHDVADAILSVHPDYRGRASVTRGHLPYPLHSTLNLQFLKDMRDALTPQ